MCVLNRLDGMYISIGAIAIDEDGVSGYVLYRTVSEFTTGKDKMSIQRTHAMSDAVLM